MKRKVLAIAMTAILVLSLLSGCGKKNDVKEDSSKTAKKTEKEEKEELKEIGKEAEGAFQVKLVNETGQDITAVSVKSSAEEKYPDNMLENSEVFQKDETRILYYKAAEEAKETETESGKALPPEFSIQLTLADETIFELHSFPFEDIEEGKIKLQDQVAYIVYKSVESKSEVNTLDAELATKAAADAEAAAQAEAQAQAEAEAQAQAAAAAAASQAGTSAPQPQQQTTYQEPEPVYHEPEPAPAPAPEPAPAPAPEPPAENPGTEDDGCVGDGLTY